MTFNREAFAATCPSRDVPDRIIQNCDEIQYLGPVAIPSIGVEASY